MSNNRPTSARVSTTGSFEASFARTRSKSFQPCPRWWPKKARSAAAAVRMLLGA
ncbi:hypothetical protein [Congregicoccus parvus]|uniref:hypothetical protein n=1 Tax=Congregicoccus parvus TaxID=3081749 RepID=UPI003FA571EC